MPQATKSKSRGLNRVWPLADRLSDNGVIERIVRKMQKYESFIQRYSGASDWSDIYESVHASLLPPAKRR
jgi:uncharacterized protein YabN with tetrapyrrole methylase and pyrophosphatase domain